jgi:transcriptional regulator with XRE-family HTH domain
LPVKKPTLGSLLRALRGRLGLTLKDMSERTGIPFSTLSKVEHDRLTLTYDKLQMISERLNVPLSELFAEAGAEQKAQANGRRSIGTLDSALRVATPNHEYFYLCPELRHKHMIPIISRIHAHALGEAAQLVSHGGEEFVYVLEGKVAVHTEFYDPLILSQGEFIYLDSKMGHAYLVGDEADSALMLSVSSTSQEELIATIPAVAPPPVMQSTAPVRRLSSPRKRKA